MAAKRRTPAVLFLTLFVLLKCLSCANAQSLICTRVVDGDTIILSNGEKVRLIGVDTPETVRPNTPVEYYGKEASAFTKKMVEGKPVLLEYDWQQRDKYGRLLAYVYLMDGAPLSMLRAHSSGKDVMIVLMSQIRRDIT